MAKPRGTEHTTLTETAKLVVTELQKLEGIKMIAPGEIKTGARRKSGGRFVTAVYTTSGCELIITGQSVQRVAVHTDRDPQKIIRELQQAKRLRGFSFAERSRKPGV